MDVAESLRMEKWVWGSHTWSMKEVPAYPAARVEVTLKLNPRDSRLLFMAIRRLLAFGYDRVIKGFDESDFC